MAMIARLKYLLPLPRRCFIAVLYIKVHFLYINTLLHQKNRLFDYR